jgi:hypothetical protein
MLTREQLAPNLSDQDIFNAIAEEAYARLGNLEDDAYYAILPSQPSGIRAYAGIWDLDVSMSMDDVAWHFANHYAERHIESTLWSLQEINAMEVHNIFAQAVSIVRPHLETLRSGAINTNAKHKWLKETGIQAACNPLNKWLWEICEENPDYRLLSFAIKHARNSPDRFIPGL